ncbi:unnamed protein product [Adineta steineri]|uniref:Uncharacterized protein n=1 Tax=Adineta steineri TaxID=433720 RepID=A0A819GXN8_9BILA|nr:unnamed protein product [Adineta steineri]CAF3888446.1 unnamed protein product [Adineta steineri]
MASLLRQGNRNEPPVSAASQRTRPIPTEYSRSKKSDKPASNTWEAGQVWIQNIAKEDSARKQWEKMHGWLADYDAKANIKPRKRIAENVTRFSNTVPNSRGHDYGWRLESDLGQEINNLQGRLNMQYKKQRSKEILGYD